MSGEQNRRYETGGLEELEQDTTAIPVLALRPLEAARALGISERTLAAWTADPESQIPHVKIGRVVMYPVGELQRWLAVRARGTE